MHNSEKIIADILARADFWRQYAHVEMTARQRKVVNRLLDAGCDGLVGGLTTRKYVAIAKTSRATAFREISDLVEKGILVQQTGAGRNVHYALKWDNDL